MQVKNLAVTLGLLALSAPSMALPQPNTASDSETSFNELKKAYEDKVGDIVSSATSKGCTKDSISTRRSWDDLNTKERHDYIAAVKCLHQKPALMDKALAPSAKVRADDFTFQHINQTNFVHVSGIFMPFHRQYVWLYEQALREECGYQGYLPYWDWVKYSDDQSKASVFQGGLNGFGGNGLYVPHSDTNATLPDVPGPFYINRTAGTGGGCVTDGAFANLSVNLGYSAPANNPPSDPYGVAKDPHCLARDFNQQYSNLGLTYDAAVNVLNAVDYADFITRIDTVVHPSAHQFLGGDGYDFYSSPSDPVFFLLHSQIDRLWTIWQGQDQDVRKTQVGGTVTFANIPPSANATLDTVLRFGGAIGDDVTFAHTISSVENGYCYTYA